MPVRCRFRSYAAPRANTRLGPTLRSHVSILLPVPLLVKIKRSSDMLTTYPCGVTSQQIVISVTLGPTYCLDKFPLCADTLLIKRYGHMAGHEKTNSSPKKSIQARLRFLFAVATAFASIAAFSGCSTCGDGSDNRTGAGKFQQGGRYERGQETSDSESGEPVKIHREAPDSWDSSK